MSHWRSTDICNSGIYSDSLLTMKTRWWQMGPSGLSWALVNASSPHGDSLVSSPVTKCRLWADTWRNTWICSGGEPPLPLICGLCPGGCTQPSPGKPVCTVFIHSLFRIIKLTCSQSLAHSFYNTPQLESWIKTIRAHFPWSTVILIFMIYSQLSLKRTPSGPKLLSGLERCLL